MPDVTASSSDKRRIHRAHWRQNDVWRAISAAERAGLRFYRVEIGPDGTISIVVGDHAQGPRRRLRR